MSERHTRPYPAISELSSEVQSEIGDSLRRRHTQETDPTGYPDTTDVDDANTTEVAAVPSDEPAPFDDTTPTGEWQRTAQVNEQGSAIFRRPSDNPKIPNQGIFKRPTRGNR